MKYKLPNDNVIRPPVYYTASNEWIHKNFDNEGKNVF